MNRAVNRAVLALAGGLLLLAGCGSSPDPAAEKACTLLRDAENDISQALWLWIQDGKPTGGSEAVRLAQSVYPAIVVDAAAAAPAELASDFSTVKRLAPAAMYPNSDQDSYVALNLTVRRLVESCEEAGVDMQMVDMQTGETK